MANSSLSDNIRLTRILVTVIVVLLFFSCGKEKYDEQLLIGKWRSGQLYYTYESNYRGKTWDESED